MSGTGSQPRGWLTPGRVLHPTNTSTALHSGGFVATQQRGVRASNGRTYPVGSQSVLRRSHGFKARGWHGLPVREVAREANVNHSTIVRLR